MFGYLIMITICKNGCFTISNLIKLAGIPFFFQQKNSVRQVI